MTADESQPFDFAEFRQRDIFEAVMLRPQLWTPGRSVHEAIMYLEGCAFICTKLLSEGYQAGYVASTMRYIDFKNWICGGRKLNFSEVLRDIEDQDEDSFVLLLRLYREFKALSTVSEQ